MSSGGTDWLWSLSEQAMSSAAWKRASQSIVHLTKTALEKKNVLLFSDLSPEEQSTLMDEIEREMLPKDEYYAAYARELDRKVSDTLQQIALQRSSVAGARHSRLQFVVSVASEGSAAFLRKWPDRFEILRLISHRGLPPGLRVETWRMQLRPSILPRGPEVEVRISEDDADIWTRCRLLLRDLNISVDPGGGNLHAMKAVLSHLRATRFQDSKMRIEINAGNATRTMSNAAASENQQAEEKPAPAVFSPLEFVIAPLVAALGEMPRNEAAEKAGIETVMLMEHLQGVVTFSTYDALIDVQTGEPRNQWATFVSEVSRCLEDADLEFHGLLSTVAASTANQNQKQRQTSSLAAQGVTSAIWRLHEPPSLASGMVMGFQSSSPNTNAPNNGAYLGPLVLPLVRRLFVGVVADIETTCYLWDMLLILGPKILPLLCASYLLALRTTLSVHLSNASYVDALERTLSISGPRLGLLQLKPVIDQYLGPALAMNPELSGEPSMGLPSIAQSGIPLSGEGDEVDALWGEGKEPAEDIKIPIKRKRLLPVNVASQTGHHVTTMTDPERILSPAHHSRTEQDEEKQDAVTPLIQVQQDNGHGEQKISVNYLGTEYALKLPQIHMSRDRISNVADQMLNDPSNEALVAAVLTHEHQLPTVVARMQGQSLRTARASGIDPLIWRELRELFPSLMDDYSKPMLRYQVSDRITANTFHIYAPPIDGDARGALHTLNKILENLDADLTESQIKNMAEQLEIYSLLSGRGRVAEPDWEPVGVTLTLNENFERRIGSAGSKDAITALWRVIQSELAQVLRIPTAALDLFDLSKGSILVDFNINAVKGDHRSPNAMYDELATAVNDPTSSLHDKPLIRSAVRVHKRGTPHQIHRKREPGEEADSPKPEDTSKPASIAPATNQGQDEDQGLPKTPRQRTPAQKPPGSSSGQRPPSSKAAADTRPATGLRPGTGATAADRTPSRKGTAGSGRSSRLSLARASVLSAAAKALQSGWEDKKYFYADGKAKKGPVDFKELADLYADNRVLPDTYVWYKSMGDKWKKLLDNPPLLDALRSAVVASAGSTPLAEGFSIEQEIAARRIQLAWREIKAKKREEQHPSKPPDAPVPVAPSQPPQPTSEIKPATPLEKDPSPPERSENQAVKPVTEERKTLKPPSPPMNQEAKVKDLKERLDAFYRAKAPDALDKSQQLAEAHWDKERLLNAKLRKKYGADLDNYNSPANPQTQQAAAPPGQPAQQPPDRPSEHEPFDARHAIRLQMAAIHALFVGSEAEMRDLAALKDAPPATQPPRPAQPPTQPSGQPAERANAPQDPPNDKAQQQEPAAAAAGPPAAAEAPGEPDAFDARRALETQMEAVEGLFVGTADEVAQVRQMPPANQDFQPPS